MRRHRRGRHGGVPAARAQMRGRGGRWEWWSDRQMVGLPRGPAAAVAALVRTRAHFRPTGPRPPREDAGFQ